MVIKPFSPLLDFFCWRPHLSFPLGTRNLYIYIYFGREKTLTPLSPPPLLPLFATTKKRKGRRKAATPEIFWKIKFPTTKRSALSRTAAAQNDGKSFTLRENRRQFSRQGRKHGRWGGGGSITAKRGSLPINHSSGPEFLISYI